MPPIRATAEDIPLTCLYEDDSAIVIDKAAGMVVHAGAGVHDGTLVNALLHRFATLSTSAANCGRGLCTGWIGSPAAFYWWLKMMRRIGIWRRSLRPVR